MTDKQQRNKSPAKGAFNSKPKVGFDPTPYEKYLKDTNLSEAQKQALLQTLWGILSNLVELRFGVHPVQQAVADKGHCGQHQIDESVITATLLECTHTNIGGQL